MEKFRGEQIKYDYEKYGIRYNSINYLLSEIPKYIDI